MRSGDDSNPSKEGKMPVTRAKKRMDRLMRHLTAQPASKGMSPSSTSTPHRQELRRELASAQRDRLRTEYGYELDDDGMDPMIQEVNDQEEDFDKDVGIGSKMMRKRLKFTADAAVEKNEEKTNPLDEARIKLAKACRLAHAYGVAGSHVNDDSASVFVPGHGYLFKPLGLRFDEVTADRLLFTKIMDELPKLHVDLYHANPEKRSLFCIISASNDNCEMVSITRDGLLPLCQDALRVHGKVRRVDELNLGVRASRISYKGVTSWLVKNRGAVCTGSSIEMALANLVYTTRACAFQVRACAAVGGDLSRLDVPDESEAIRSKAELQGRCTDESAANSLFTKI